MTAATSACGAWVMEDFSPYCFQSPSTRSARHVSAEASEPVPGSVSAVQPMASPEMSLGSHSSRTAAGACAAKKLVCTLTKKYDRPMVEQA